MTAKAAGEARGLKHRYQLSLYGVMILVLASSLLIAVYRETVGIPASQARDLTKCRVNLHEIGIALRQYHEDFGRFPPAIVTDRTGTPLHSWRVLLLPYLGQRELYSRYHFDEPWNGPTNRTLGAKMPDVYGCPSAHQSPSTGMTSYLAMSGPGTAFPDGGSSSMTQFGDGLSQSLLLVESTERRVPWMAPLDLKISEEETRNEIHPDGESPHRSGRHVLFASGDVHLMHQGDFSHSRRQLATIDGKDIPTESPWDEFGDPRHDK